MRLVLVDERLQRDLEIDLVIGGVDAGGVVDGVGVEAPAGETELYARPLGEAEIAAFADDARAYLGRVHIRPSQRGRRG